MRGIVRDVMLFHAGDSADPQTRVGRARWMLDQLAKSTGADTAYGAVLRQDARLLAAAGDDYVFHEFLEQENSPCHVREFFAAARRHGLEYLSEADICTTYPERYGPDTAQLLRAISSNAVDALEQYIDYFSGRAFRQTLLVKTEAARQINRQIPPGRVASLSFCTSYGADPDVTAEGRFRFRSPHGPTLTTGSPVIREALSSLANAGPATRTPAELLAATLPDRQPTGTEQIELLNALLQLLLVGMAEASTVPVSTAREIGERPLAAKLARLDAEAGRMWTTNMLHQRVSLNVVQQALLPKVDGHNDRTGLEARLLECVRQGTIRFERDGVPIRDDAGLAACAEEHVGLALQGLQRAGLLVVGGPFGWWRAGSCSIALPCSAEDASFRGASQR
jgi:methyltransferase-like protein